MAKNTNERAMTSPVRAWTTNVLRSKSRVDLRGWRTERRATGMASTVASAPAAAAYPAVYSAALTSEVEAGSVVCPGLNSQ